jgi:hypothetical protein
MYIYMFILFKSCKALPVMAFGTLLGMCIFLLYFCCFGCYLCIIFLTSSLSLSGKRYATREYANVHVHIYINMYEYIHIYKYINIIIIIIRQKICPAKVRERYYNNGRSSFVYGRGCKRR